MKKVFTEENLNKIENALNNVNSVKDTYDFWIHPCNMSKYVKTISDHLDCTLDDLREIIEACQEAINVIKSTGYENEKEA